MSTRGVIARLTHALPAQFAGRYHHWESRPSGLGRSLWQLYHGHFNRDQEALLRALVDEHPAGWSSIIGADFNLCPGFTQGKEQGNDTSEAESSVAIFLRPACYCHGERFEGEWLLTERNAGTAGCQWAYAFTSTGQAQHDVMLILAPYTPVGQQLGHPFPWQSPPVPRILWRVVAVVALRGEEPDWEALNEARPLDPLFDPGREERSPMIEGPLASPNSLTRFIVEQDDRPGIYRVMLPLSALSSEPCPEARRDGPCHYVCFVKEEGERTFYCTCSEQEEAPSPSCQHVQAVQAFLDQTLQRAKERQARGLEYSGARLESQGQGGTIVFVWEAGEPTVMQPHASLRLCNYSPMGFDWSYQGSSPAQLALAILLDFTRDEELALRLHQEFKRQCIAALPREGTWSLSAPQIEAFLQERVDET